MFNDDHALSLNEISNIIINGSIFKNLFFEITEMYKLY